MCCNKCSPPSASERFRVGSEKLATNTHEVDLDDEGPVRRIGEEVIEYERSG